MRLLTPDGQKIRMIFGDNLWRLPMWSDPARYINDETSPVNRNTLALVPTAAALEALAQPSLPDQESTTCGAILATTRWSKSSRHGVGDASREASLVSFANFIVPLARCRSAHVAIAVPSVSKWPQPSESKWPPPSERSKLTRCKTAPANRRRKSKTLVQLSSSCRAKDVSVFSGAHRVWQVISQIPTAVPALLIIIRLQQSRLNVCTCARRMG